MSSRAAAEAEAETAEAGRLLGKAKEAEAEAEEAEGAEAEGAEAEALDAPRASGLAADMTLTDTQCRLQAAEAEAGGLRATVGEMKVEVGELRSELSERRAGVGELALQLEARRWHL